MNERIKELAVQADLLIKKTNGDEFRYGNFDPKFQKFAELIVRECADCVRGAGLADDVALRNNLGFNDGIAEGVVHIQKHFGVE